MKTGFVCCMAAPSSCSELHVPALGGVVSNLGHSLHQLHDRQAALLSGIAATPMAGMPEPRLIRDSVLAADAQLAQSSTPFVGRRGIHNLSQSGCCQVPAGQVTERRHGCFEGHIPGVADHSASVCAQVQQVWPQRRVEELVRRQFPRQWLANLSFPVLEDRLARPCFTSYSEWWDAWHEEPFGPAPPDWSSLQDKVGTAASQGDQLRAHGAKDAFPSLIHTGLLKEDHFREACAATLPWNTQACVDYDLRFAAKVTIDNLASLRAFRRACIAAMGELAH